MKFYLKSGDTRPWLRVRYRRRSNGELVDFDGATVKFSMKSLQGSLVIDSQPAIVESDTTIIHYEWAEGDTDYKGKYYGELFVDFGDEAEFRIPAKGYIEIEIEEAIA